MKKTIKAIIAGTTVFLASTLIPGCTVAVLSVPYGMTIDDSYRMTWNDVENARGYVLSIKGDDGVVFEDEARRPTYSLEDLEEGDYEIRIKADGGDSQYADSEWSEVVYFHREYENGCIYTLINNDTEYEVSGYGTSSGVVEVGGLYRGKPVTQIGDSAFRNSRNLESITLLDSVTHIGENAFFNCSALKAVVLSDNLTYIGSAAFQSCAYLESIVIPDKVTEMPRNMFAKCNELVSITYGSGITQANYVASAALPKLAEIIFMSTTPPTISADFLEDQTLANLQIKVPAAAVDAYKAAENWSAYANYIVANTEAAATSAVMPEALPAPSAKDEL